MADTFASFSGRVERFADDVAGRALRETLEKIGQAAKKDAAEAVSGDLGDLSMSNWRRGRPIPIQARYEVRSDHEVELMPTPRSRGPWRVLEDGRQAVAAGGQVEVGRRRKDGTRRTKRSRGQGSTRAKQTWSDAMALMDRRTPDRIDAEVKRAIRRRFD